MKTLLEKMSGGAARIQPSAPNGRIGRTETWVIPKSVADNIINQAGNDPRKIEKLMGYNNGYLGNNPVLIAIPHPTNARIPSGNELGANSSWFPGGKTSPEGLPEAIIDPVFFGAYVVIPILEAKEKVYDNDGLIIFRLSSKYYVQYDAGSHQIAMREDEVSEKEAHEIMKGTREATQVLFNIQKKLEASGINPYASNVCD